MHVEQDDFYLQKAGNSPGEYEDAFWLPPYAQEQHAVYRCAIADGATETSFSSHWAKLLVEAYGEGKIRDRIDQQVLEPLQQRWAAAVSGQPLPWYAEEKVRQGAYASFLGLRLTSYGRSPCRWKAIAVGDSCLFQLRGTEMTTVFPIEAASDFNNRPLLISSNPTGNEGLDRSVFSASGTWEQDDVFFLITDALACWVLKMVEAGEPPWVDLRDLKTGAERLPFKAWIGDLRTSGTLRNDDVTLLRIEPMP